MRKLFLILLLIASGLTAANAQFTSFGKFPVDIVSDQETRFVGGVAVAEQNVVIRYRDTTIYADYAEYNDDTRDVLVRGNVRIYREGHTFVGDRAVYNLETKQLRAANFRGDFFPFRFTSEALTSMGTNEYLLKNASLTTSDSSKPDYYLRARTVRIYSKDHVVFTNVALYVGKTPVFWWPYLYQSLDQDSSFSLAPGYRSNWGTYLLYSQNFPISDSIVGRARLDLRSSRGAAAGLEADYKSKTNQSWAKLRTYVIDDSTPGSYKIENATVTHDPSTNTDTFRASKSIPINATRYRVNFQSKFYISDDIYSTINLNKLSDPKLLKDFMPGEYRLDPQPDNVVALTKLEENYTLTGIARMQLNKFFETTERLPEFTFDMKRTAILSSPVFYEGETGVARLKRNFPSGTLTPVDYSATRLDSFHQFVLPTTVGGWLSIIPRIGVRGTYYNTSGLQSENVTETIIDPTLQATNASLNAPLNPVTQTVTIHPNHQYGNETRGVFNTGFEASFKASREYNDVQSRAWGLDGLRHVVQPYTDFSYVYSTKDPADFTKGTGDILPFDRFLASDQLPSFTFPQFTGVDSIANWTVWRLGVRNRLQTRRDDQTINWLTLDSYFNVNIKAPAIPGLEQGTLSNFYNSLAFRPVPWMSLKVDSQIPLASQGFTEANTSMNFFVNKDLQLSVGHRFLSGNPFFTDSNLIHVSGYYRINENWGVSASESYEAKNHVLETQRYEIHRDLSSWIVSLGAEYQNNTPNSSVLTVLATFTLKAFPIINLPLSENPNSGTSN